MAAACLPGVETGLPGVERRGELRLVDDLQGLAQAILAQSEGDRSVSQAARLLKARYSVAIQPRFDQFIKRIACGAS